MFQPPPRSCFAKLWKPARSASPMPMSSTASCIALLSRRNTGGFQIPEDLLASALRDVSAGLSSFAELRRAGLLAAIESKLPMRQIDEIAPTHLRLPGGRRARIEYHEDRPPSVASRLQDFFGLQASPDDCARIGPTGYPLARSESTPCASHHRPRQLLEKSLSASSPPAQPPLSQARLARNAGVAFLKDLFEHWRNLEDRSIFHSPLVSSSSPAIVR